VVTTAVSLYPLRFAPFLRPMPWGGERLRKWLDAAWPDNAKIGEAWLLSDHPLHQSVVTNGPLAGTTLHQLLVDRGTEVLGNTTSRFPLLVKLLDAQENLSIQVHPDDELARKWAPQEGGKSEAWLVLESSPDAAIYLGLKPGIDRSSLLRELGHGTLPLCMKRYDPLPGQCYNVPAGSVHALGGGTVVLEVQQTSDATFRLFDWNRVDAAGKPRPLHLEAGLACMKDAPAGIGLQNPKADAESADVLVDGPYFRMKRRTQTAQTQGPCLLVCLGASASLKTAPARYDLRRGELWLVPAVTGQFEIEDLNGDVVEIVAHSSARP
jgi:mannose-6-phosphate isomerase